MQARDLSYLALVFSSISGSLVRVLGMILTITFTITLTKYLSPEDFGKFVAILAYSAVCGCVIRYGCDLRAPSAIAKPIDSNIPKEQLIASFLRESHKLVLHSSIILWLGSFVFFLLFGSIFPSFMMLVIVLLGGIALAICFIYAETLRACDKTTSAEIYRSFVPAFLFLIMININDLWSYEEILILYYSSFFASAFFAKQTLNKITKTKKNFLKFKLKLNTVKFLTPFFFISLINIANQTLPVIILDVLSNDTEVGNYGLLQKMYFAVVVPINIAMGVVNPRIADLYVDRDFNKLASLILFSILALLVVGITSSLILHYYAVNFFEILNPDLIIDQKSVDLFAIALLVSSLGAVFGGVLIVCNGQRDMQTIALISLVFFALSAIYLVPGIGSYGGAIAFVMYTSLYAILCIFYGTRRILSLKTE